MEHLQPAGPADLEEVRALLRASGLPTDDVAAHLAQFTVARDAGRLVGTIGLEVHGKDGLVRSLAVVEDRRGQGIARRLYAAQLGKALQLGLERLYVLAETAQGFFELIGFRPVGRDAVPPAIRDTLEFRARAEQATCMSRVMPRGG